MSFSRYPSYRDSGIDWLGELPAHWTVTSLKRDAVFVTSGARGWAENYSDDGDLFLRIGNLTRTSINLDLSDIQRVNVEESSEGARTQVRAGDVLFSITAYLGSVAVVPQGLGTAYVSQHVALARLKQEKFLPEWVAYVASSYVGKTYLETQGYGGTKIQLSLGDVASLLVTAPPLDEQVALTRFLGQEAAKIDALVEEQKRLIELLKEKRQAAISLAVTKGLDPSVPMKDSGVEWFGNVPAHWTVKRFVDACDSISTGPFGTALGSDDYISGGVPVINPSHIAGSQIVAEEQVSVAIETANRLSFWALRAGDIVVARRGELGRAAIVGEQNDGWICGTGSLRVTPKRCSATAEYLHAVLQATYAREWLNLASVGSTMANLNEGILGRLPLAIPSDVEEQSRVTSHLFEVLSDLSEVETLAQEYVALLLERRAALISAAVTGKIDVRGLVPQAEAVTA